MSSNVSSYIDRIISMYDVNASCDIIENYTLKVIENFIDKKDTEGNLAEFLGNLAFLYSKEEVNVNNVQAFIKKLSNFFPYSNIKLINHVSNFMEIVLTYHSELMCFYLNVLNDLNKVMEPDYSAILYKSCALCCYKKYADPEKLENKMLCTWRYDYEMATFNKSYRKYFKALSYVNSAIKYCPDYLKKEYIELRKDICKQIKHKEDVVD